MTETSVPPIEEAYTVQETSNEQVVSPQVSQMLEVIKSTAVQDLISHDSEKLKLSDNGRELAKNLYLQTISASTSYYDQMNIIRELREHRDSLGPDYARIIDRLSASFTMQAINNKSAQVKRELQGSEYWQQFLAATGRENSNNQGVAHKIAKYRYEVTRFVMNALPEGVVSSSDIESAIMLVERKNIEQSIVSLRSRVGESEDLQSVDPVLQTMMLYGDIEPPAQIDFTAFIEDVQRSLVHSDTDVSHEVAAETQFAEIEEIIGPINPELVPVVTEVRGEESDINPIEQIRALGVVGETQSLVEKSNRTNETTRRKVKDVMRHIRKWGSAAVVGVGLLLGVKSIPFSTTQVSAEQLSAQHYREYALETALTPGALDEFTYVPPVRVDQTVVTQPVEPKAPIPEVIPEKPQTEAIEIQIMTQEEKENFLQNLQEVGGRNGYLISGDPGNYVGEFKAPDSPVEIDDTSLEDLYELKNVFEKKRSEFDNYLAVQFPSASEIQFEVASYDEDNSGAITDKFTVSPTEGFRLEIDGIEFDGAEARLRVNNTYVGDGKVKPGEKSGVIFVKMPVKDAIHYINTSKKGSSTLMYSVATEGYLTNVQNAIHRISASTAGGVDSISMINASGIDKVDTDYLYSIGYVNGYTVQGKAVAGGMCGGTTHAWNEIMNASNAAGIEPIIEAHQNHTKGTYTPGTSDNKRTDNLWRDTTVYNDGYSKVDGRLRLPNGKLWLRSQTLYWQRNPESRGEQDFNNRSRALFVMNGDIN